jgi:hypothetical protein
MGAVAPARGRSGFGVIDHADQGQRRGLAGGLEQLLALFNEEAST